MSSDAHKFGPSWDERATAPVWILDGRCLGTSDYACIAGVAGVVTYDLIARPGQTISEAYDRYLVANPLLTELALLAI